MSDHELLKLAAKAAGIFIGYSHDKSGEITEAGVVIAGDGSCEVWNPLTNDGDALRLAVRKKLIVTFADGGAGPHVLAGPRLGPFVKEPLPVTHFLDQETSDSAATRRAIVRAAAEIGKNM